MPCVLKTDVSGCQMSAPAGSSVILKLVPATGAVASIIAASYDGQNITPTNDELAITLKAGRKNLSIQYLVTGNAELHEKCDGNTLLDDDINPVNNLKAYFVCGVTAAATGGGGGK